MNNEELIERLRARVTYAELLLSDPPKPMPDRLCVEAATCIEALAAENAILKGKLESFSVGLTEREKQMQRHRRMITVYSIGEALIRRERRANAIERGDGYGYGYGYGCGSGCGDGDSYGTVQTGLLLTRQAREARCWRVG